MNYLDFIGASLSLICTYYFTQAKRIAWVIGIAAILLNSVLYWQKGIYGHLILESIYFGSMIIGWFKWSNTTSHSSLQPLMVKHLSKKQYIYITVAATGAIGILSYFLKFYTQSDIPFWDATTTILSLCAQLLLCFKFLQCWVLWFVVDLLIALLQLYKNIPFHSALHFVYLYLAIKGYLNWQKIYLQHNKETSFIRNFSP